MAFGMEKTGFWGLIATGCRSMASGVRLGPTAGSGTGDAPAKIIGAIPAGIVDVKHQVLCRAAPAAGHQPSLALWPSIAALRRKGPRWSGCTRWWPVSGRPVGQARPVTEDVLQHHPEDEVGDRVEIAGKWVHHQRCLLRVGRPVPVPVRFPGTPLWPSCPSWRSRR